MLGTVGLHMMSAEAGPSKMAFPLLVPMPQLKWSDLYKALYLGPRFSLSAALLSSSPCGFIGSPSAHGLFTWPLLVAWSSHNMGAARGMASNRKAVRAARSPKA